MQTSKSTRSRSADLLSSHKHSSRSIRTWIYGRFTIEFVSRSVAARLEIGLPADTGRTGNDPARSARRAARISEHRPCAGPHGPDADRNYCRVLAPVTGLRKRRCRTTHSSRNASRKDCQDRSRRAASASSNQTVKPLDGARGHVAVRVEVIGDTKILNSWHNRPGLGVSLQRYHVRVFRNEVSPHLQSANRSVVRNNIFRKRV